MVSVSFLVRVGSCVLHLRVRVCVLACFRDVLRMFAMACVCVYVRVCSNIHARAVTRHNRIRSNSYIRRTEFRQDWHGFLPESDSTCMFACMRAHA